jgi:hypothetical protein
VDGAPANGPSAFIDGGNDKSGNTELRIGNNSSSGQYQFYGGLSDLMIYNRALTPTEVKLMYSKQKSQSISVDSSRIPGINSIK